MSDVRPTASRRTALALGLGVIGVSVSGCDLQDLDPRDPLPAPGTGTKDGAPDLDADEVLVAEVVAIITAQHIAVEAVRRRHRSLRAEFDPLTRMHRAHLEVLNPRGGARAADPGPSATARPAADRRRVVQAERTLRQQVARASERAEAGQVAKLLASVSASIAQHLAALEVTQ